MVGNTKLPSSGLDGPAFGNDLRGALSAFSSLDRSGSFREGRGPASGPSRLRNGCLPVEIPPLNKFLTLDNYSLGEQKYTRYNELRRVLGVSLEEQHSFGSLQSKPLPSMASEEVKWFRSSLQESSNRARDRRKALNESIVKLDKYRNIHLKKQRNDGPQCEKSGSSTLLKMGGQIHHNLLDPGSQTPEERTRNAVPNKRARSSSERRSSVSTRPGAVTGKEKSMHFDSKKNLLRTCNGASMPSEDNAHRLPAGGDGWEIKQKRKRSVGTTVNRVLDGDRDLKQPIQQRPNIDPHQRNCDGIGFRPGTSNAITGANKTDPGSQLSGASSRAIPKNDMDNCSLPSDRREHCAGPDKERTIVKGSNKLNIREDTPVGNQSPLTKGKVCRAPRTGSSVVTNTTSSFPRTSGSVDGWEYSSCQNIVQPTGATNRKRSLPTGSPSSLVAQWVGERPQKSSRTRRASVVSPVSNFEEAHILSEGHGTPDLGSRLTTTESSGLLFSMSIPNKHVPSPACISESEESGATGNKSKDKETDNGDVVEDRALNVVRNVPTFVFPSKKKKVSPKEEIADGVRGQGRSGRGSIQTKACLPVPKGKLENMDITKPFKSGRPGSSDKSASRVGRPPSRKASDRKTYIRPGQVINNSPSELKGESADDREELLKTANAARNASYLACSSSFWRKMEPLFSSISTEDIDYVKHQINFAEDLGESLCNVPDADCNVMGKHVHQTMSSTPFSFSIEEQANQSHVVGQHKYAGTISVGETRPAKTFGKLETRNWPEKIIPLSERLLSYFIAEDGTETYDCIIGQGDGSSQFSSDYSPYWLNSPVENDTETDRMKSEFERDLDFKHNKNYSSDIISCNGYSGSGNFRSPNIQNFVCVDAPLEGNVLANADTVNLTEFEQNNLNPLRLSSTDFSGGSPSECQSEHLSLDDRILMELHSIGLFPETVPDLSEGEDEEVDRVISELQMRLYQQVRKKKNQLLKLQKAIQERKEIEERNLEQLAMNKLVETAYKKIRGGRGNHGSSHKGGASKAAKQHALAFAKRTLARCRKFEETGRSCFNEVFPAPLYSSDATCIDGISSQTAASIDVASQSCQLGSRASGSGALASCVMSVGGKPGPSHKVERSQLDLNHGRTYMSEQTFAKNDQISIRGKKREVLLDDVVTNAALRATPTLNHTSSGGAKGKRTEKDKDQNKETVTRTTKAGRLSLSNGRGERKTKTKSKSKQKTAQLSTSGNGIGRIKETSGFGLPSMPESFDTVKFDGTRLNQEAELTCSLIQDLSKEMEDNIFTNMPLRGIDSINELDEADGLGGQGQDIGSFLNFDDDALQDNDDLVGLHIPMDDLSELHF